MEPCVPCEKPGSKKKLTDTPHTTVDSRSGSLPPSEPSGSTHIFAASAPLVPPRVSEEVQVKTQTSAPCYFFSLEENDAPPFRKPGKETRPHILIGTIMNEAEVIEMIAAADSEPNGLRKFIGSFLVDKKVTENYNISEKQFLISLVSEAIDYAAQREFSAFKLAALLTIYLDTHLYFKWYFWSPPAAVWAYFKEIMIRHTIEDSPDGEEVFEPEECYDILTHFHTTYLSNLPLVHLVTFRAHRLKFMWPFKAKV